MAKRKTISQVLKQAIRDSGMTPLELERETGVKRQSIMWFMRGDRSLHLDSADALASYLGIECRTVGKAARKD